jgi:hypothetical protein
LIIIKNGHFGSDCLKETNEHKYLAVYFLRWRVFSYHINSYLKYNFEKKYSYIIKLLGEHGSFNRIFFGDALWKSIIRPSITHGCAVCIPSSNASIVSLELWQYKVAKLILNTNMYTSLNQLYSSNWDGKR